MLFFATTAISTARKRYAWSGLGSPLSGTYITSRQAEDLSEVVRMAKRDIDAMEFLWAHSANDDSAH